MNREIIDKTNKFNKMLNRIMPLLTPVAVIVGIILGDKISWMKGSVTYLFAVMTFFGAMKISVKEIGDTLKHPLYIVVFAIGSYIIMPLLAECIGMIFFHGDKDIISGYNLLRAIPTGVVTSVWTAILSGNLAATLSVLLLDTFLSPIMTPFLLKIFTGEAIAVDTSGMIRSLIIMVIIPSILALIFNHFYKEKIDSELAPLSNPLSKIILFFVIAINSSKVSDRIIENLSFSYIFIALASLIIAVLGFIVGFSLSKLFKLERELAVSITVNVGMRNISAALVLAIEFLPPAAALPVIFGIVFQQSVCATMGSLLFGRR